VVEKNDAESEKNQAGDNPGALNAAS